MKKIYLDDIRTPQTQGWIIIRNFKDFVKWIEKNGLPGFISFDHDLSDEHYGMIGKTDFLDWKEYYQQQDREYTGYDCAKWLCEYCLENNLPIPDWNVHSANTVGKENINFILKHYQKKLNHA